MKKSFFTPDEVTKFKKLYPVTMNTALCKMFGLSESQLRSRANAKVSGRPHHETEKD